MSEQVWYIYQQNQQLGPFGSEQLKQLVDNKMIAQDAYFFKVGWKDWRPVEDCLDEIGATAVMPPATAQRPHVHGPKMAEHRVPDRLRELRLSRPAVGPHR